MARRVVEAADDRLAARDAVDEACEHVAPDRRSGNDATPELGEHDGCVRHPETEAALLLGQAQREHAHLRQLLPDLPAEGLLLELGNRVEREAALAERADAFLERHLIFSELEFHD